MRPRHRPARDRRRTAALRRPRDRQLPHRAVQRRAHGRRRSCSRSRTVTAGSSIPGVVVVVNNTGAPLNYGGCGGLFAIALTEPGGVPDLAWLGCLQQLTVPEGESSYPAGAPRSCVRVFDGPDLPAGTRQVRRGPRPERQRLPRRGADSGTSGPGSDQLIRRRGRAPRALRAARDSARANGGLKLTLTIVAPMSRSAPSTSIAVSGFTDRIEQLARRQHHLERRADPAPTAARPTTRTPGPGPTCPASSARWSPNGAQPSASSTARRSDRCVRPPIHNGTVCLHATRIDDHPRVVEVLAVELGLACDRSSCATRERLVAACAAVVERRAEQVELGLERPHADAEDEPPVGDAVEGAVALGNRERVVVAEHQHVGREPDTCGDRVRYPKVASGSQ